MGAEEMIGTRFESRVKVVPSGDARIATVDDIKSEPMLFSASIEYALRNGGPLTKQTLEAITEQPVFLEELTGHSALGYHPVIDTKSVMLMPGWFPCIPGWHCDAVPRADSNSQPDVSQINEPIYHYTRWIGTDAGLAPTEFYADSLVIPVDKDNVWGSVDAEVNKIDEPHIVSFTSGTINKFMRSALHRGTPADNRGWRYFFRMSYMPTPCRNEIRNQVQVYPAKSGW